jgi:hypothetical protein
VFAKVCESEKPHALTILGVGEAVKARWVRMSYMTSKTRFGIDLLPLT